MVFSPSDSNYVNKWLSRVTHRFCELRPCHSHHNSIIRCGRSLQVPVCEIMEHWRNFNYSVLKANAKTIYVNNLLFSSSYLWIPKKSAGQVTSWSDAGFWTSFSTSPVYPCGQCNSWPFSPRPLNDTVVSAKHNIIFIGWRALMCFILEPCSGIWLTVFAFLHSGIKELEDFSRSIMLYFTR